MQPFHCDSADSCRGLSTVDPHDVSLSVLLAVMPGSRLLFKFNDGSIREIVLQLGDVLVFRGDRCHAGAPYDYWNVRIHAYVDLQGYRESGYTFPCTCT